MTVLLLTTVETETFGQSDGPAGKLVEPRFETTYVDEPWVYTATVRRREVLLRESLERDERSDCAQAWIMKRSDGKKNIVECRLAKGVWTKQATRT